MIINIMIYLYILLIGLIIGSFLNVCIFRIPVNQSIVYPPSTCGSCGTRLKMIDMFPVINYIISGGRCKYCKAKYSFQYPLVELFNGILYLLIFYKYKISMEAIHLCILISLLLVISFIDYKYKIIPDRLIIFGFIISIIFAFISKGNISNRLIGMLIGFGIFMLIAIVTNAMGGGDIKLMALLGFIFGIKGILFITIFSFILGAVLSVGLLVSKIKSRKDEIPFGPFISLAALLYIFFGEIMIQCYIDLLF